MLPIVTKGPKGAAPFTAPLRSIFNVILFGSKPISAPRVRLAASKLMPDASLRLIVLIVDLISDGNRFSA